MRPFFTYERPIAIAHRGSRTLFPENTMVAFQGAVDLGYRYLETDLHSSADGVLVCVHDDTLDRTTNGSGRVSQHHLTALQELDAGFRFDPIHHFPYRGEGVSIPTFEELVHTFPEAHIVLDLKQSGIEDLLVAAVDRWQLWDRVIVGSFRDSRIARFRKRTDRRVATSSGPIETLRHLMAARTGRSTKITADALQVPVKMGLTVVDQRTIDTAHGAGKQVHVWTVNEAEEMHRLLDMGVDGIITDEIEVLRNVMQDRGSGGPWNS